MTELGVIVISVLFFITLIVVKVPFMHWYYRFRKQIWHRWLIWKIERKLAKTSIEKESSIFN